MISILLMSLLLSFFCTTYLSAYHFHQRQNALYDQQRYAKNVIEVLTKEITQAGYIGCPRLTANFVVTSHLQDQLNVNNKIMTTAHQLIIQHASTPPVMILTMKNKFEIEVNKGLHFRKGEKLLIANCQTAELFQVAQVKNLKESQLLIATTPLTYHYDSPAEVSRFHKNRYFIAKNSLFLQDITGAVMELVPHISNLIVTTINNQQVAIDVEVNTPPFKKTWHLFV